MALAFTGGHQRNVLSDIGNTLCDRLDDARCGAGGPPSSPSPHPTPHGR